MNRPGGTEPSDRNADIETIVHAVTARHGVSHMGAAWLHAHEFLEQATRRRSKVGDDVVAEAVATYDPREIDDEPDEDAPRSSEMDPARHATWTPFNDAQIAQSIRLVSIALSRLPTRLEFVLRHSYGIGIPTSSWQGDPDDPADRAFSIRTVSERLGLTRGVIDQNLAKAHRTCVSGRHRERDHPSIMMRAALEQFGEAEVDSLCASSDATFRCAIKHDHADAIARTENRIADKMMTIFPELAQMRNAMAEAPPRDQMSLICSNWKARSNRSYSEAVAIDRREGRERWNISRLQQAWIDRTSDENAILKEIGIVAGRSGLEMAIVPALHAGDRRKYRILATYRGRTSDEVGVRIPSGTPFPGELKWAHAFPTEMLYDVRDSLTQFAIAVLAREKAESTANSASGRTPASDADVTGATFATSMRAMAA